MNIIINEENLKDIDPQLLLDRSHYQEVQDMVISIEAAATADYAKDYVELLSAKIDAVADQMSPQLFNQYLALVKVLKLCTLSLQTDQEKQKFFREEILDVIPLDFVDIRQEIDNLMRMYYNNPEIIQQLKNTILEGFENNLQRLGTNKIAIKTVDQPATPTLRNWLIDYRSFAQSKADKVTRGTLEEVSYINKTANPRQLSSQERDVLLKVLKLYDWMTYTEFKYDFSFPGQEIDNPELEGNSHELIPQEIVDAINKVGSKKPEVTKPVVREPVATPKPIPPRPKTPIVEGASIKPISAFQEKGQDLSELEKRVMQVAAAPAPAALGNLKKINLSPQEIKREVLTKELPGTVAAPKVVPPPKPVVKKEAPKVVAPKKEPVVMPTKLPPPGLEPLDKIQTLEDLKKIQVGHLRQGPLNNQLIAIKSKILNIASQNRMLPYFAVNVFEQSPLFRAYLQRGSARMLNADAETDLTQQEFEAIADFRKEIEKL